MLCQSCGHQNRADAAYCEECRTALTRPCQTCGEPVPAGASNCSGCGAPNESTPMHHSDPSPQLVQDRSFARLAETPSSREPLWSTHDVSDRRVADRLGSEFTGVVRDFQQRQGSGGDEDVWNLRVERHDPSGNKLVPIPVEMRGHDWVGSLSDGDEVHVSGRWRDGTLRVEELKNLTTDARVRAKSYRRLQIGCLVIFCLIVVGFLIGCLVVINSGP
ncbi:zinc ribbon domain-containing protein [Streptomyces sp. NPDC003710]